MFEINKQQFGTFLAEQRKKQGFTQKELAAKLFVSDKAVSKWERGGSLPDITLLVPLSEQLQVSVAELLESRNMPATEQLNPQQAETLLKKALTLSDEVPRVQRNTRMRRGLIFFLCVLTAALELLFARHLHYDLSSLFVYELLSIFIGAWFYLLAREALPSWYDEHAVSFYSDGILNLSIPGVTFNNRNWQHILHAGRLWNAIILVAFPAIGMLETALFDRCLFLPNLLVYFAMLFLPLMIAGKKHP